MERFSRHALDRDLESGQLIRLLPGVYVGARFGKTFDGRVSSVDCWIGPRGAIGGAAAVALHGLGAPPSTITVMVDPRERVRGPAWMTVKRWSAPLEPVEINGIRVASIPDAILQAWCELPAETRASPLIDAIRDRRTSTGEVARRAARYPRLPNRRALQRLIGQLEQGAESYLEVLALTRVFNTREFRGFSRQVRVAALGQRYVLDMFDRSAKVAIELDGRRFHNDDIQRRRDLERDANLAAIGIIVLRFTYEDIVGRRDWCRLRVRRATASRRAAPDLRQAAA